MLDVNRFAEYDSLRDLIAAHQDSEVEPRTASQAPSDAGREVPPPLASRPANPYPCHHCGQAFRTRRAMQAHRASVHPIRSGRPAYTPEPERHIIRHHQWPWGGAA